MHATPTKELRPFLQLRKVTVFVNGVASHLCKNGQKLLKTRFFNKKVQQSGNYGQLLLNFV